MNAAGRVELWCNRCPDVDVVVPAVAAIDVPPPPPAPLELARTLAGASSAAPAPAERRRRAAPLTASAALVLVVAGGTLWAGPLRMSSGDQVEPTTLSIADPIAPQRGAARPARPAAIKPLGVTLDGEPIEERYPTLAEWVHPVLGTDEPLPANASRRFGAHRDGKRPAECGGGHCGVDLSGERGTPILSVAPGVVAQVHRDSGGRGGRYIRIQHPDDSISSYFHLDEIADLRVGDEVQAGQQLGLLGRSGIKISGPHLHFGVAISDGERLRNIDPVPFLERASTLKHPVEP